MNYSLNYKQRSLVAEKPLPGPDSPEHRYVAENLLIGVSGEHLVPILRDHGYNDSQALSIIKEVGEHPYLQAGEVARQRLKKRDWILGLYSELWRYSEPDGSIDEVESISPEAFFADYFCRNKPLVIRGYCNHWAALKKWDLDYLELAVDDPIIEYQTGREEKEDYEIFDHFHRKQTRWSQFIRRLRETDSSNDFYLTANNGSSNREILAPLWEDFDAPPELLAEDAHENSFLGMGPKGTRTPFHHDLSNILHCMVVGEKKFAMVPTFEGHLMRNHKGVYSMWSYDELDSLRGEEGVPFMQTTILGPGDAIFLPLGYWHYIKSLSRAFSISFSHMRWKQDFGTKYDSDGWM